MPRSLAAFSRAGPIKVIHGFSPNFEAQCSKRGLQGSKTTIEDCMLFLGGFSIRAPLLGAQMSRYVSGPQRTKCGAGLGPPASG